VAIAVGGSGVAERALLSYSRAQENAADQAALRYLDAAGLSARGLMTFLDRLADQELLSPTRQDPYLTTHPVTRDRVEHVRQHVALSPLADAPTPPEFAVLFDRIRAKLAGFIEPPASALRRFPESDGSVPARYGRAIALHRKSDLPGALALIDGLLAQSPDDPFFHELKGQVLYESGRAAEAVPDYEAAVAVLPDEPLLRLGLAQALLETGDDAQLDAAVGHLEAALRGDRDFAATWRLAGLAYGRQGREPEAALAAAENALLLGRREDARHFAERALKGLAADSPAWFRAQDILVATEPEP
ncbi:MAG: M48 family metalloprotease, partial [Alphaproteobacteria bacterium]